MTQGLGLIVVGDYALATGADRHVPFAASLLGRASLALDWAWLIPASRIQLAAALHEAWQRPHPVACLVGSAAASTITPGLPWRRYSGDVMRWVCRVTLLIQMRL